MKDQNMLDLEKYIKNKYFKSGEEKLSEYLNNKEKIKESLPKKFKILDEKVVHKLFLTYAINYDLQKEIKKEGFDYIKAEINISEIIIFFWYKYAFTDFMLEYKNLAIEVKNEEIVISELTSRNSGFQEIKKISLYEDSLIVKLLDYIKNKGDEFFISENNQRNMSSRINHINDQIKKNINLKILKNPDYTQDYFITIDRKYKLFNLNDLHKYNGYIFNIFIYKIKIDTSNFSSWLSENDFYNLIKKEMNLTKDEHIAVEEKRKIMKQINEPLEKNTKVIKKRL